MDFVPGSDKQKKSFYQLFSAIEWALPLSLFNYWFVGLTWSMLHS